MINSKVGKKNKKLKGSITNQENKKLKESITNLEAETKKLEGEISNLNKKISPLVKRINKIEPHLVEKYLTENTKRVKVVKNRFEVMLTKVIVATELNWLYGKDKLDKDHNILLAAIMHSYDLSDQWWLSRIKNGTELRDWRIAILESYRRKINNVTDITTALETGAKRDEGGAMEEAKGTVQVSDGNKFDSTEWAQLDLFEEN